MTFGVELSAQLADIVAVGCPQARLPVKLVGAATVRVMIVVETASEVWG